MRGKIAEVFESIQGEGLYVGERQIFVRFYGCNLSCRYCDTKLKDFKEYEPDELVDYLKSPNFRAKSISFTGGEPLLQDGFLKELLPLTYKEGFSNYLETNGTLPQALLDTIDYLDTVAMDFKLPSSAGPSDAWLTHQKFLEIAGKKDAFVKIVICESTDEQDLLKALELIREVNNSTTVVLQPDSFANQENLGIKLKRFQKICFQNNIVCCVIAQMHKVIGVK